MYSLHMQQYNIANNTLMSMIIDGDFFYSPAALTFTPSLDLVCTDVIIVDDPRVEYAEMFIVAIISLEASITTGPTSNITIIDNDG